MRRFSAELTDFVCALIEGDLPAADGFSWRAQHIADGESPFTIRLAGRLMLAGRALGDGRLEEHEQHVAQLRELCASVRGGLANAWLYHLALLAEARDGWAALGGALGTVAPPELATSSPSRHDLRAFVAFAWLRVQTGQQASARVLLSRLSAHELAQLPVMYGDLGVLCQLAETYVALADLEGARLVFSLLAPFASRNAVGPCLEYRGSVAYYLGLLARLLGHADHAQTFFAQALRVNQQLRMPFHVARARAVCER
jgi:hypothetical protein